MHPDYRTFSVEDFARDDYFRQWVMHRDPTSEAYWTNWLTLHPDLAGKVQLARAFLYALDEKTTALPASELAHMSAIITQPESRRVRSLWPVRLLAMAAALALLLGLGYLAFLHNPDAATQNKLAWISPMLNASYHEVDNTAPAPKRLTLQDGSVVTLYQNSRLQYPRQFTVDLREVYLTGRAFFTITKNSKRPFWVHTDRISTQVLGTSFLVSADGENATVEVHSGRVSVYARKDIQQARQQQKKESVGVVLTANQQVAFIQKEDRLVKSIVQQPLVLQPAEANEYVFDEAPIAQVFKQLEKTYGLPVMYDPLTVKHCFITANLSGESLFEKLNLVCRISQSTYEIVDGQIIIHSLGCDTQ